MKRLSLLGLLAATMGLLAGCPLFDDNGPGAPGSSVGVGGSPNTTSTFAGSCFAQSDCVGVNETCGSDFQCHTGDCTIWGCANKEACVIGNDQKAHCGVVQGQTTGAGGNTGTGTDTGTSTDTGTTTTGAGTGGSLGTGGAAGGAGAGTGGSAGAGTGGAAGAGNGGAAGAGNGGAAGGNTGTGGGAAGAGGAGGSSGTGTTT